MAPAAFGTSFSSNGTWGRSSEQFPDPFCDVASMAMPRTMQDALRWCEYIMLRMGPYREAINRVISYFITEIEISAVQGQRIGREEKQKYLDFLNDVLGIKAVLHTVALDFLAYGNSFTSLLMPFRRYLSCPACHFETPLRNAYTSQQFAFAFSNFEFTAHCPLCQHRGKWRHIDRRSDEQDKIRVKRWNPHEMEILWDPYTESSDFIWRIPEEYRTRIRKGELHVIEPASWEIIQAVKRNESLRFEKDVVYHMKEDPPAGVRARGWGVSRVLTNFSQAWYLQVLHRYNEAIALDYVVPFRVITPMPRPGQGGEVNDPVLSINMGSFVGRVNQMLRERRRDPARWNVLPFPVEYKALGGDATQLAPKDLLDQGMDTLLSAIGIPVELYKGTMSLQAAPASLRVFEANWAHLPYRLNRFLMKLVERIGQILSWEPVLAKLQRVQHADDLNRQMAKLQLMMGGQISKGTGLSTVGLDFESETRRTAEEQRIEAEIQQETAEEMQQAQQMDEMTVPQDPAGGAGPMPPTGAPGAGQQGQGGGAAPPSQYQPGMMPLSALQQFLAESGTQVNDTPETLQSKAQSLAQEIHMMPETQRQSALIQLKKKDSTMHALVKSILESLKRDAEQRGAQLIMQQEQGQKQAQWPDRLPRAIDI